MRYYKVIFNGYITAIGTGAGGTEITAEEYSSIKTLIAGKPTAPDGFGYKLTAALAWEQCELPPVPPAPELWTQETLSCKTNEELEQLLYSYGFTGRMNKSNMIQIILMAQGENG